MFDNVPDKLTNYLRSAVVDFDRESFYYFAAATVALFYLHKSMVDPETSDFLNIRRTSRGGIWYGHSGRVILIGETLFLMRSTPGFPEFCRRMAVRDLRSTYFESYAARMFIEGGYQVFARPESGVRGKDFDFQAVRDGETVNVEVTALTAPNFAPETVKNALQQKRKQLPDTDPAIVFCILPESWWASQSLGPPLTKIVEQFFERTRRIAAVVFVIEKHFDFEKDGPVGYLSIQHLCLSHPNPRQPVSSLDFFKTAWEHTASATGEATQRRENEFFWWVDSIFATRKESLTAPDVPQMDD
jgi:hypothetical protein